MLNVTDVFLILPFLVVFKCSVLILVTHKENNQFSYTTISSYPRGIHSQIAIGCLKPRIVLKLIYTIFSYTYITFHIKKALCGFSLTYLNYQHHYSYSLGPLLSKLKVAWRQHSWSDICDGYQVTNRQVVYTSWIHWKRDDLCTKWNGTGWHEIYSHSTEWHAI